MPSPSLNVIRLPAQLTSDDRRVIPRYLDFGHPPRIRSIFRRTLKIPRSHIRPLLEEVEAGFKTRHRELEESFRRNYVLAARHVRNVPELTDDHRLLIGAYFTMEYSIESAALFNPSMVPHPDQSGVPEGDIRFLMSLRATGEGHVSSIVFRRGVIDGGNRITFDPPPRYAYSARPVPDKELSKDLFHRKLHERGASEPADRVLEQLEDPFTLRQLRAALEKVRAAGKETSGFRRLNNTMLWLAQANYELHFPHDCMPSETVIFPATQHEANGMEDLRLVRFVDDDGECTYYGTYTAFDGLRTHPMMLKTRDFERFHFCPLSGRYARNKGMALFPRKTDGYYVMLSRHDGENLHVLRSHDELVWNVGDKIQTPQEDWELVQLGNCGSPLETEAGWLMITHGVGPMRRYCIGASLLDRDDPSRLIGRLREPLLAPSGNEREGYVPNVVYSCGAMIHGGRLVIPYAMSDSRTAFAVTDVDELLRALTSKPHRVSGRKRKKT
ncbi:MAG: glycoside hydrolase family 130 protein [Phycisphaerae bacterium]